MTNVDGVAQNVRGVLRAIVERKENPQLGLLENESAPLYEVEGGLGLDSLDTAELSATLEQLLGHDPYTSGEFPQTVGELIAFISGIRMPMPPKQLLSWPAL